MLVKFICDVLALNVKPVVVPNPQLLKLTVDEPSVKVAVPVPE